MTAETPSNQMLARELLAAGGAATLATLGAGGGPFASYVVSASAADGTPLMLLSDLAEHAKNLARDPRASLLIVREPAPGSEAMSAMRLTLVGRAEKDADAEDRRRFVARHPDAARYADFSDFSLYRFEVEAGHLVAGFGRIVALTREDLLAGASSA
jgi:heme oxygenase (biliverdin-IX-beta and delta-forming)